MADVAAAVAAIEQLLEEMVVMQRKRVLEHARRLNGRLTDDDVQQPQDFPELSGSPEWNYEDGLLGRLSGSAGRGPREAATFARRSEHLVTQI
jgi:hypothetical protein